MTISLEIHTGDSRIRNEDIPIDECLNKIHQFDWVAGFRDYLWRKSTAPFIGIEKEHLGTTWSLKIYYQNLFMQLNPGAVTDFGHMFSVAISGDSEVLSRMISHRVGTEFGKCLHLFGDNIGLVTVLVEEFITNPVQAVRILARDDVQQLPMPL